MGKTQLLSYFSGRVTSLAMSSQEGFSPLRRRPLPKFLSFRSLYLVFSLSCPKGHQFIFWSLSHQLITSPG
jgi:hypothetical protein